MQRRTMPTRATLSAAACLFQSVLFGSTALRLASTPEFLGITDYTSAPVSPLFVYPLAVMSVACALLGFYRLLNPAPTCAAQTTSLNSLASFADQGPSLRRDFPHSPSARWVEGASFGLALLFASALMEFLRINLFHTASLNRAMCPVLPLILATALMSIVWVAIGVFLWRK